jgi:hypothetical protein
MEHYKMATAKIQLGQLTAVRDAIGKELGTQKFVFDLERVPQKSGGVRYGNAAFGSIYIPQEVARNESGEFDAHVTILIQRGAH